MSDIKTSLNWDTVIKMAFYLVVAAVGFTSIKSDVSGHSKSLDEIKLYQKNQDDLNRAEIRLINARLTLIEIEQAKQKQKQEDEDKKKSYAEQSY